jgi:glycosyltransferase involved in cell wall biosynthesis
MSCKLLTMHDGADAQPVVSIVIATYNRPHTLRHAVQSVRNSSLTDWELIVVGDACTDETAECVLSFGDPRIRFVNLPVRTGDQSSPNNHGLALARGKYVAFLNHDDIYFPDHLSTCVAELERSGADLVWVPCAVARPKAKPDDSRPFSFALIGVPQSAKCFSPLAICLASCWAFRRGLADRVGPWRSPDRLYVTPSQDWLFRAWRSGAVLRFLPTVTVIVILAGPRPGSYARQSSPEHEMIVQSLRMDPKYRERILEEAAINEAIDRFRNDRYPSIRLVRRLLLRPFYWLLIQAGIHPLSLPLAIVFGRRGGLVRKHRKTTGAEGDNAGSQMPPSLNGIPRGQNQQCEKEYR